MCNRCQWTAYGRYFGFPSCCVQAFIDDRCKQTKREHPTGPWVGSGFVPCPSCATAALDFEKFTAERIAPKRMCGMPFPIHGPDYLNEDMYRAAHRQPPWASFTASLLEQVEVLAEHGSFKSKAEIRRRKHIPVAMALRCPETAQDILAPAYAQVELWRRHRLCSIDYVEEWEALLAEPLAAAELLEEDSPRAERLRQNSPFVSAVRRLNRPTLLTKLWRVVS